VKNNVMQFRNKQPGDHEALWWRDTHQTHSQEHLATCSSKAYSL